MFAHILKTSAGARKAWLSRKRTTEVDAYHGSGQDFDQFDLSKAPYNPNIQQWGHGLYFATDKAMAAQFANRSGSKPTLYKVKLNLDADSIIDAEASTSTEMADRLLPPEAKAYLKKNGGYKDEGMTMFLYNLQEAYIPMMSPKTSPKGATHAERLTNYLKSKGIAAIRMENDNPFKTGPKKYETLLVLDNNLVSVKEKKAIS